MEEGVEKEMKLAIVEWVDSAFAQGWMGKDAIKTHVVSTCVTVGILVNENKEQITIVQSASVDKQQYGDGITIPKVCIKRIRYLTIKEG